jgi:nitrate/nitrite-specific signal transduction histidine kinase
MKSGRKSEKAGENSSSHTPGNLPKVKQGMEFKLFLIAACISLVGVLVSSFLVLTWQREQLIADAQETTSHLGNVIEAGLEHAMLRNDRELINQIIKDQAQTHFLSRIQVLNNLGVVKVSSDPADIGQTLQDTSPTCQFCQINNLQSQQSSTGFLAQNEGRQVILNVNLIYNRPECQDCHSPQENLLGLLVIEKPITDLSSELLTAFWRIVAAGLFTFSLLLALLTWTNNRFILKPVRAINQGIDAISSGDLDTKIEVTSQDELGRLANAFNSMREQLQSSQTAMEQKNQELALLNDIALSASQMLDPQQIMELALDTVVDRLGMHSGFIRLYDEETNRFTLRAARGVPIEFSKEIERRRTIQGWDISQRAIETGQVIFISNMADEAIFREVWEETNQRSFINIPLMSRGAAIGTLALVTYPGRPLPPENLEILQAVGHEIGIAIDNALLLKETQDREQEARSLYRLSTKISESLEIDQVLQMIANGAREFISADLGMVGLVDDACQEIVFKAVTSSNGNSLQGLQFPKDKMWDESCQSGGYAIQLQDLTEDHGLYAIRHELSAAGVASILVTPFCKGSKFQGLILAANHHARQFHQKEIQSMNHLARRVFDAVENAQLYQKVGYLATLEERERLAREMHDELAQALGLLNLKSSLAQEQLANGQVGNVEDSLQEIKEITRSTYINTREAIFNLRNTTALGTGMLAFLKEYLAEYSLHYGLDARLKVEDTHLAEFPPNIALQINCIIQESLTNIRKHAQATHAWVRFERQGDQTHIIIQDDGRGFDPEQVRADSEEHFGLQIMRERAESVGARLELDPQLGHGTRVAVCVPRR